MWCCQSNVLIRNTVEGSRSSSPFDPPAAGGISDNGSTAAGFPSGGGGVMSSTLVETVSINYEDFTEYFLTCGTCLCSYDGAEHTPKLLPCSHTVCLHCLSRIVASPSPRDDNTFRCPICRENIRIPSGGVAALPPSFLVNQLLDLMSTQRREVIPKCSTHSTQELMFCESCDLVFCLLCNAGSHHSSSGAGGTGGAQHHTVIPLAIAVKRMSEILCYKANECYAKLNTAAEAVNEELHRLDHSVDGAFEAANRSFEALADLVEQRRREVIAAVEAIRDSKRSVLQEQLTLISSERERVRSECEGLQYQVEVRAITKKIQLLNTKIDSLEGLVEPRENAFLRFEPSPQSTYSSLCGAVKEYGRVATSRTLPSLCTLSAPTSSGSKPVTHLRTHVTLHTVDYQGHAQVSGGDPVEADVVCKATGDSLACDVQDNGDGTYAIVFTPTAVGTYKVSARIFERPVKNNPAVVEVCGAHNPHTVYGTRGAGSDQLLQPAAICVDPVDGTIFVADTGNSRIKVLDAMLSEQHHLVGEALEGRGVTGLALTPAARSLVLVNWRSKTVTELTQQGEIVQQFQHDQLQEPTTLAVNSSGLILVVDTFRVMVFSASGGTLLKTWGTRGDKDGQLGAVSAICAVDTGGGSTGALLGEGSTEGETATATTAATASAESSSQGTWLDACAGGEVVLADHRLQVFATDGSFIRTVFKPAGGVKSPKGTYGGLCLDSNGLLLASRQERTHSCVQVFDYYLGSLIFTIDSSESKLKRPAGLAATTDGWLLVLDIANCCLKKFRYRCPGRNRPPAEVYQTEVFFHNRSLYLAPFIQKEVVDPDYYCIVKVEESQSKSPTCPRFSTKVFACTMDPQALDGAAWTLVSLSHLLLVLAIAAYIIVPDLRSLQGQYLLCLLITLLLYNLLLFPTSAITFPASLVSCMALRAIKYFFFCGFFLWFNTICFDVWRTVKSGQDISGRRRFLAYSCYAWLLSAVLATAVLVLDITNGRAMQGADSGPGGHLPECQLGLHPHVVLQGLSVLVDAVMVAMAVSGLCTYSKLVCRLPRSDAVASVKQVLKLFAVMICHSVLSVSPEFLKITVITLWQFVVLEAVAMVGILIYRRSVLKQLYRRCICCCYRRSNIKRRYGSGVAGAATGGATASSGGADSSVASMNGGTHNLNHQEQQFIVPEKIRLSSV